MAQSVEFRWVTGTYRDGQMGTDEFPPSGRTTATALFPAPDLPSFPTSLLTNSPWDSHAHVMILQLNHSLSFCALLLVIGFSDFTFKTTTSFSKCQRSACHCLVALLAPGLYCRQSLKQTKNTWRKILFSIINEASQSEEMWPELLILR